MDDPNPESREAKPSWSQVPRELVTQLGELLRARIAGAETVWGGFGPSATFVIHTDDGRRFFCKGSHPDFTEDGKAAVRRERGVYAAFPELEAFSAAFHGSVEGAGWQLLVLDYMQRSRDVPPWSAEDFRAAIAMLARFHRSMPPRAPAILQDSGDAPITVSLSAGRLGWRTLAESEPDRQGLLALFADRDSAAKWFDRHIAQFVALDEEASRLDGPRSWVHLDVRSDNLIFRDGHEPMLVDWPFLSYGSVLMDVAFFLPSVAGEGGPPPHAGLAQYEQESGMSFDEHHVRATAAAVAGFFAARAGQPPIPGLPRLRWVQAMQLFPCLDWLSRLLEIDPPPSPVS